MPTMTDSLLALGEEVLYQRYHIGKFVEATIDTDEGCNVIGPGYKTIPNGR